MNETLVAVCLLQFFSALLPAQIHARVCQYAESKFIVVLYNLWCVVLYMLYILYIITFFLSSKLKATSSHYQVKIWQFEFWTCPTGHVCVCVCFCLFACVHIWIRICTLVWILNLVRVCGISLKTDGAVCFLFALQYIHVFFFRIDFCSRRFIFKMVFHIHR